MDDIFDKKKFRAICQSKDSEYRNSRVAGYEIVMSGMSIFTRFDVTILSPHEIAWAAKNLEVTSKQLFALSKEYNDLKRPNKHKKVEFIVRSKIILEGLKLSFKDRLNWKRARKMSQIYRADNQQLNL